MRTREIDELIAALAAATGIQHIFDDCLAQRSGGPVQYIVTLEGHRYLAWQDFDSGETVVSPAELWDQDNLADAIDDQVPTLIAMPSRSHVSKLIVSRLQA